MTQILNILACQLNPTVGDIAGNLELARQTMSGCAPGEHDLEADGAAQAQGVVREDARRGAGARRRRLVPGRFRAVPLPLEDSLTNMMVIDALFKSFETI